MGKRVEWVGQRFNRDTWSEDFEAGVANVGRNLGQEGERNMNGDPLLLFS
jgi:hypothetical protein